MLNIRDITVAALPFLLRRAEAFPGVHPSRYMSLLVQRDVLGLIY
jgi:hypothetical protein